MPFLSSYVAHNFEKNRREYTKRRPEAAPVNGGGWFFADAEIIRRISRGRRLRGGRPSNRNKGTSRDDETVEARWSSAEGPARPWFYDAKVLNFNLKRSERGANTRADIWPARS